MIKEVHKVVRQVGSKRVIIANSATSINNNNNNDIVVDGSHCGRNVGEMMAEANIRGMIGSDAGMGKDNACIAGLRVLADYEIPAAAVSCMSARIGDGTSTYEEGVISAVNEVAKSLGVTAGMSAKDAAERMFEGTAEPGQRIIRRSGVTRLIVVDTTSDVHEANSNDVVVTGSHGGRGGGEYLARLNVKGVICHDAGIGKGNAGIASLRVFEEHSIPAATVSSMSAYIGNGMSTYEKGKISVANEIAKNLGIVPGMSAKLAADKIFGDLVERTKQEKT